MKVAEGIGKGAETGDKSNSASGRMIAVDAEIVSCRVTVVTQYEEIERAARGCRRQGYITILIQMREFLLHTNRPKSESGRRCLFVYGFRPALAVCVKL